MTNAAAIVLFGLFQASFCSIKVAYLTGSNEPWGKTYSIDLMSGVFGTENVAWDRKLFDSAGEFFCSGYDVIVTDASDTNWQPFSSWIGTRRELLETWVLSGGRLYINALPLSGLGGPLVFGKSLLVSNATDASLVYSADDVLSAGDVSSPWNTHRWLGFAYSHGQIVGDSGDDVIMSAAGAVIMERLFRGAGAVVLSSLTSPSYHYPRNASLGFRRSVLQYLKESAAVGAASCQESVSFVGQVTSPAASGRYYIGDSIEIHVMFSFPVVTWDLAASLKLRTGYNDEFRLATYVGGNGTSTLRFQYLVMADDVSGHLAYYGSDALVGAIVDLASFSPALLTLPAPGAFGSLDVNKNFVINIAPPTTAVPYATSFAMAVSTELVGSTATAMGFSTAGRSTGSSFFPSTGFASLGTTSTGTTSTGSTSIDATSVSTTSAGTGTTGPTTSAGVTTSTGTGGTVHPASSTGATSTSGGTPSGTTSSGTSGTIYPVSSTGSVLTGTTASRTTSTGTTGTVHLASTSTGISSSSASSTAGTSSTGSSATTSTATTSSGTTGTGTTGTASRASTTGSTLTGATSTGTTSTGTSGTSSTGSSGTLYPVSSTGSTSTGTTSSGTTSTGSTSTGTTVAGTTSTGTTGAADPTGSTASPSTNTTAAGTTSAGTSGTIHAGISTGSTSPSASTGTTSTGTSGTIYPVSSSGSTSTGTTSSGTTSTGTTGTGNPGSSAGSTSTGTTSPGTSSVGTSGTMSSPELSTGITSTGTASSATTSTDTYGTSHPVSSAGSTFIATTSISTTGTSSTGTTGTVYPVSSTGSTSTGTTSTGTVSTGTSGTLVSVSSTGSMSTGSTPPGTTSAGGIGVGMPPVLEALPTAIRVTYTAPNKRSAVVGPFFLEMANSSMTFEVILEAAGSFVHTEDALQPATSYWFRVRMLDDLGAAVYSPSAMSTTLPPTVATTDAATTRAAVVLSGNQSDAQLDSEAIQTGKAATDMTLIIVIVAVVLVVIVIVLLVVVVRRRRRNKINPALVSDRPETTTSAAMSSNFDTADGSEATSTRPSSGLASVGSERSSPRDSMSRSIVSHDDDLSLSSTRLQSLVVSPRSFASPRSAASPRSVASPRSTVSPRPPSPTSTSVVDSHPLSEDDGDDALMAQGISALALLSDAALASSSAQAAAASAAQTNAKSGFTPRGASTTPRGTSVANFVAGGDQETPRSKRATAKSPREASSMASPRPELGSAAGTPRSTRGGVLGSQSPPVASAADTSQSDVVSAPDETPEVEPTVPVDPFAVDRGDLLNRSVSKRSFFALKRVFERESRSAAAAARDDQDDEVVAMEMGPDGKMVAKKAGKVKGKQAGTGAAKARGSKAQSIDLEDDDAIDEPGDLGASTKHRLVSYRDELMHAAAGVIQQAWAKRRLAVAMKRELAAMKIQRFVRRIWRRSAESKRSFEKMIALAKRRSANSKRRSKADLIPISERPAPVVAAQTVSEPTAERPRAPLSEAAQSRAARLQRRRSVRKTVNDDPTLVMLYNSAAVVLQRWWRKRMLAQRLRASNAPQMTGAARIAKLREITATYSTGEAHKQQQAQLRSTLQRWLAVNISPALAELKRSKAKHAEALRERERQDKRRNPRDSTHDARRIARTDRLRRANSTDSAGTLRSSPGVGRARTEPEMDPAVQTLIDEAEDALGGDLDI
eukprot:TRINITY_DN402_c0_g1_i1.p1 TRINITY_DN402_c0_g1~~TRINITY_DN402_c0_g1_i1.p1  ORF type:complete len:1684 (-),score=495.51 TRINITY_DN402_c0_g1_i1:351-5402(-)